MRIISISGKAQHGKDTTAAFLKDAGAWDYVLIPDCRFPNEVVGTHLRVKRPRFDNGLSEEQKQHPSETALDDCTPDITICNSGSLESLEWVCEAIAEDLDINPTRRMYGCR